MSRSDRTPSRNGPNTPLFGLRWVPDSQLRPLRYMPSSTPMRGDDDESWRNPPNSVHTPSGPAPKEEGAITQKLQQDVRMLTQRLTEAQESVRQKVEQIRWLKEMTKDDASRARVARWMRGPLLRVFQAWKREVRHSTRRALEDLQVEHDANAARGRELQARCDDLSREHAVLQVALEHYFGVALAERERRQVAACWRRWVPLRRAIGVSVTNYRRPERTPLFGYAGRRISGRSASRVGRTPVRDAVIGRRAIDAANALNALRQHARRGVQMHGLLRRVSSLQRHRKLRRAFYRVADVLR